MLFMMRFAFLSLFCCLRLCATYPRVEFSEIDFSNMQLIRQKLGVQNYRTRDSKFAYKIWVKKYSRTPLFLAALKEGFFNEISPLVAVIYDDQECRGYITKYCKSLNYHDFDMEPFCDGSFKRLRISEQSNQSEKYFTLYEALVRKAKETSLFYYDLTPMNMVSDGDEFLIIDLESIEKMKNLRNRRVMKRSLLYVPQDYLSELLKINGKNG